MHQHGIYTPHKPQPIDPILKQGAVLAQGAEARDRRLAQLERDLIATLPQEAMNILAQAFSLRHGVNGISDWQNWLGRAVQCPLDANTIEDLHHRTIEVHSLRAAASALESQPINGNR